MLEDPPFRAATDDPNRRDEALDTIVPENANKPYDMREIITRVVDDGHLLEIQPDWAQNMMIGFARHRRLFSRDRRESARLSRGMP